MSWGVGFGSRSAYGGVNACNPFDTAVLTAVAAEACIQRLSDRATPRGVEDQWF